MPSWFRKSSISLKKLCSPRRLVLVLACVFLCGLALGPGRPLVSARILGVGDPVLYLLVEDSNGVHFVAADADTVRDEPNLVIITHGWYEREPWPARMALAIHQRVDHRAWCCGWYDWRGQASRLLPSDAAKVARDEAGPSLGRQIVGLSGQWRHVHLIGHSAGSWLINEAASVVASQTSASIHVTFLDAYVPKGWDSGSLGRLAGDPCETCWVEHYFTRDPLGDLPRTRCPGPQRRCHRRQPGLQQPQIPLALVPGHHRRRVCPGRSICPRAGAVRGFGPAVRLLAIPGSRPVQLADKPGPQGSERACPTAESQ